MSWKCKHYLVAAVWAIWCQAGLAQSPAPANAEEIERASWHEAAVLAQPSPPTIFEVRVENAVVYRWDVSDVSTFATDPNLTIPSSASPRNLGNTLIIADIVSVSGRPAKGTAVINQRTTNLNTAFIAGQAIADIVRTSISQYALEIQDADGSPIGNVYANGFSGGAAPIGAPLAVRGSNNAVVGGTGAFVGARGQLGAGTTAVANRTASITEDPADRRINGGGKFGIIVTLYPMSRPEIVSNQGRPEILHADSQPVTASGPAHAGETLALIMRNLGPTRPGVDPGATFPVDTPQVVNSPVEAVVNGRPAEVLNKVGLPGAIDVYRAEIRVPNDTEPGVATLQMTAAFIAAPAVRFSVR